MSKPTDSDMDAIDEMIFGIAGFLGVHVEYGRPKHVGLRALAEATVYALVEHTPAKVSGITPLAVAELLYENAGDKWARDVVTAITAAGMVTTPDDDAALAAWREKKQEEEREQFTNRRR